MAKILILNSTLNLFQMKTLFDAFFAQLLSNLEIVAPHTQAGVPKTRLVN